MKKVLLVIITALLAVACEREVVEKPPQTDHEQYANVLMGSRWVYKEYSVQDDNVYTKTITLIFNTENNVIYTETSNDPNVDDVYKTDWTYVFNSADGFIYRPEYEGDSYMYETEIVYSDEYDVLFWKRRGLIHAADALHREEL